MCFEECVCVWETQRERENALLDKMREWERECVSVCVCAFERVAECVLTENEIESVCMCLRWERERERERMKGLERVKNDLC